MSQDDRTPEDIEVEAEEVFGNAPERPQSLWDPAPSPQRKYRPPLPAGAPMPRSMPPLFPHTDRHDLSPDAVVEAVTLARYRAEIEAEMVQALGVKALPRRAMRKALERRALEADLILYRLGETEEQRTERLATYAKRRLALSRAVTRRAPLRAILAGQSIASVARRAACSPGYLSLVLRGRARPSLDMGIRIADAIGIKIRAFQAYVKEVRKNPLG